MNRGLTFTEQGWEDFCYWQLQDRKTVKRLIRLLNDTRRNPYEGIGKPEALKHEYQGWWSRRIDDEHRLIYRLKDDSIQVAACRFHYD